LAATTVVYCGFWLQARLYRSLPATEIGVDFPYQANERVHQVSYVKPGSPAEAAGVKGGDRIIAFDGVRITSPEDQIRLWKSRNPGDLVRLTILREGEKQPLEITAVFRDRYKAAGFLASVQATFEVTLQTAMLVAFAAVGLTVLLLRPDDRNVWLMALFFLGLVAAPGFPSEFQTVPAVLRPWAEMHRGFFLGMLGASFYWFCAVFPTRSPIDRRLPWLKWAAVLIGLIAVGETQIESGSRAAPLLSPVFGSHVADRFTFAAILTFLALAVLSLTTNYINARQAEARRKIRVLFWGTVMGIGPVLVQVSLEQYAGVRVPEGLKLGVNVLMLLLPVSFAYAVFKQRVLDVPVLLRRSARYLLVQRGFLLLLCLASFALTLLFATAMGRVPSTAGVGQAGSTALGAVLGTALLWSGTRVHQRISGRIDRAFFRSAYDARVILEDLARTTAKAATREELAALIVQQVEAALSPEWACAYRVDAGGELRPVAGAAGESEDVVLIRRLLEQRDGLGETVEYLGSGCVVPVLSREGSLAGVLVLGPRLSEEPYSREDKRLLAAVATQAGMALDNLRLAEDIAARLEAERRTAHEMAIAKQVQSRLLPQTAPVLRSLECAGQCWQARLVGGDYFDYLNLGNEQLALVLADVSGKGVHAALLVANLQAYLRSLCELTRGREEKMGAGTLAETLKKVNGSLLSSTGSQHFATLFIAVYDEGCGRLMYVNCGHLAPILLRRAGGIERLESTATVLGVFEVWECSVGDVEVRGGDLLVVFSDGVTEAMRGDEEFGEARLLEVLQAENQLPPGDIVGRVFDEVKRFSGSEQWDDVTLVVARCTSAEQGGRWDVVEAARAGQRP
jgi:sigma-B regulation protein RsbU (phosphoserine phosphatase)